VASVKSFAFYASALQWQVTLPTTPPSAAFSPGSLQLSQVVAATFVAYFCGSSFLPMWKVFAFAYCPAWKKLGFVAKLNATCVCFTAVASLYPTSC